MLYFQLAVLKLVMGFAYYIVQNLVSDSVDVIFESQAFTLTVDVESKPLYYSKCLSALDTDVYEYYDQELTVV